MKRINGMLHALSEVSMMAMPKPLWP